MVFSKEKSNQTMLLRLGPAAELIDNKKYLPMFRNRQKQCEGDEWGRLVELAKGKREANRWFAVVCGKNNWARTLKMLRQMRQAVVSTAHKVAKYFGEISPNFAGFVISRMALLSEERQIRLLEIAKTKRAPERYLVSCIKH